LVLIPHAAAAVKLINDVASLAIVVTNQPQLAKGLLSRDQLDAIHAKLETLLGLHRAKLDAIYFCPHHPEKGHPGEVPQLKIDCSCRKPKPGQLQAAVRDLPVLLEESCLIGDSARDVGAAKNVGIDSYGVRTGYGCRDCMGSMRPDLIFSDVFEASQFAVMGLSSAKRIADRVRQMAGRLRRLVIVGIAGFARCGKSSLAHALVRELRRSGTRALHLRLEEWGIPCSMPPTALGSDRRSRTEPYPSLLAKLLAGEAVAAPVYDSTSLEGTEPVEYRLAGREVLILDGSFACHRSIRPQLDFGVFVDCPESVLHDRFFEFHRWKGDADEDIHRLWRQRRAEEWPLVLRQRESADELIFWPNHE